MDTLLALDAAFDEDPFLDELGFVMSPPPPSVVVVEHKLGVALKALKPLFTHAAGAFHTILGEIRAGSKALSDPGVVGDVLRYTRAVLVVRGDMPMAYNLRKQILSAQPASAVAAELTFLQVLFTKHPKSPSSWEHRRWCLRRLHAADRGDGGLVLPAAAMATEMALCASSAEAYPKNYYAWMHRKWLLTHMGLTQLADELAFTRAWLLAHVSDHSAANHRDQVVNHVITALAGDATPDAIAEFTRGRAAVLPAGCPDTAATTFTTSLRQLWFIESVLAESRDLITHRPGHETLWYHRRNMFHIFIDVLAAVFGAHWLAALRRQRPDGAEAAEVGAERDAVDAAAEAPSSGPRAGADELLALVGAAEPADRLRAWWVRRVGDEARFASACAVSEAAWGQAAQRAHALRYRAYVLFLALKALDAACTVGPMPLQQTLRVALRAALSAARAEDGLERFWNALPV